MHTQPATPSAPFREVHCYRVGDIVDVYGCPCRVFKVRPLGTYDVERLSDGKCWRVSGLTRWAGINYDDGATGLPLLLSLSALLGLALSLAIVFAR